MSMISDGTIMTRGGANVTRSGTNMTRGGANVIRGGTNMTRDEISMNQFKMKRFDVK